MNLNAWMTKEIVTSYLERLNDKFQSENRKTIMFLGNFSGHIICNLSNIKLYFYMPILQA